MKKAIQGSTQLRVNPETIYKLHKKKVYILEPEKGILRTLNSTASFIWQFLLKQRTLDAVVRAVQNEFHIPNHAARVDVGDFIDSYIKKGFIVTVKDGKK